MRTRVAAQQDVDFTAAARGATALEALAGAAKELQQHSLLDVVQPPNARRCDGERERLRLVVTTIGGRKSAYAARAQHDTHEAERGSPTDRARSS